MLEPNELVAVQRIPFSIKEEQVKLVCPAEERGEVTVESAYRFCKAAEQRAVCKGPSTSHQLDIGFWKMI